jgi:hypothetical protein
MPLKPWAFISPEEKLDFLLDSRSGQKMNIFAMYAEAGISREEIFDHAAQIRKLSRVA